MRFFRNITIGQYIYQDSLIHKLDPRIKIIVATLTIVTIFLIKSWMGFFIIGIYLFTNIFLAKTHPKFILRGIRPLLILIVFTLLIHFFITPGEIIYRIWILAITREGIQRGLFIAIRLFLLILSTSWLTLTTSPIALTDGIEKILTFLKVFRVPAHEIAMMMTIALRFIPTLMEETEKIIKAQIARGADFESGNLVKRIQNFLPIIIPLFINSFQRADDLAIAMEARCYRGGEGRTHYRTLLMTHIDHIYLFITLLILLISYFTII
ncbi:MAG: energy-coupling factor transporter transmembrane protein EcfT [Candidatus Atribacteria bacterium]|nr:energy-coupling factor transporter transmembrane protein EcfT [Candidatus Atribacteria bacterium]